MEPADLNGDSYSTDHSLSCMFYLYIRRMNIQITYIQIEKKYVTWLAINVCSPIKLFYSYC